MKCEDNFDLIFLYVKEKGKGTGSKGRRDVFFPLIYSQNTPAAMVAPDGSHQPRTPFMRGNTGGNKV